MNNIQILVFSATTLAALSCGALASDYSENIHKGDYKWMQANLMYSI
ncbi:exported protein of unknown function [Moritella yayanosii]|uniref:Uncharacterized protein n=1 Tax=Moritella yayanosii TaxID=69539 RepID=A0A330LTX8_9GAMM|nr:exported protein of unknown function [Moritella yayanosii]